MVIRESEAPDYTIELQPNYNFDLLSINYVPLVSLTYKTDTSKVQQLIHGFVQGETSETWIKPKEKNQYGRLEYLTLLDNYGRKLTRRYGSKKQRRFGPFPFTRMR